MSFNFSIQTASFSKPPQNQSNHPQTTQKPVEPPTNQPNHPETTQKTSQLWAENQFFMLPKNFSNNAKHVLNLQPLYSISSTFSSEDLSQVGIEGKWRGLFKR